MSAQWNTALSGFMQNLGFADFKTNATKVSNVVIGDNRYILDIEELGDERGIVLALFRNVPEHELYEKAKQLLSACHYDKFLPAVVRVGLRSNDMLVLMARVEQASANSIGRVFDLMYKLYEEIGA